MTETKPADPTERAGRHAIIVTLGPSSLNEAVLSKLGDRGVDYVRINLSHTPIGALPSAVAMVKEHCRVPLMLDTEGSQVRTGVVAAPLELRHNDSVRIASQSRAQPGDVPLRPDEVFGQLRQGDLIAVDFDSVVLRVDEVPQDAGVIRCTVMSGGAVQSNKAVTIIDRVVHLPALSEKDVAAVAYARANGLSNYCLSFTDDGADVRALRQLHPGAYVVAKVETRRGVQNLDAILAEADAILIDRGDLSREVPAERLPFAQKHVIRRANAAGKPVYVATNFLDTMMVGRTPSRAETNDIVNTLLDGADGLVLAAETAIGRHPVEAVSFLRAICTEVAQTQRGLLAAGATSDVLRVIHESTYITSPSVGAGLISPHGGVLVDQRASEPISDLLKDFELSDDEAMDAELLALGAYSPLRRFMTQAELRAVVGELRLPSGDAWPLPVLLRRPEAMATGTQLALANRGQRFGVLTVEECYEEDWRQLAEQLYGTADPSHPGVNAFVNAGAFAIAGTVWISERVHRSQKSFELSPLQTRRLFEARGWSRVVGFHTRNAPHGAHEYVMSAALERVRADGLFIHPVVGKKKPGDFTTAAITAGFGGLLESSPLSQRAIFGTFPTYSRYAGPREALFTALCRQNYGCSHFIVGRDHTGVGNFYPPTASQDIFARFPDIGIVPVFFGEVQYSRSRSGFGVDVAEEDAVRISGTEARKALQSGAALPQWYMRPEVAARLAALDSPLFVP